MLTVSRCLCFLKDCRAIDFKSPRWSLPSQIISQMPIVESPPERNVIEESFQQIHSVLEGDTNLLPDDLLPTEI